MINDFNWASRKGMTLATSLIVITLLVLPAAVQGQTADELQAAIRSSSEPVAQAKLYKRLGDLYVEQDNFEQAAVAFLQALNNGRTSFSPRERLQMAIYLSWADRLSESRDELEKLLAEDPNNVAARTHLARVLSWSGELAPAVQQADIVLHNTPDHKEALLVKADALQWQGRYVEAIPIYQKILAGENNFEARLGLAQCMVAVGNRTAAQENLNLLNPSNARQKRGWEKATDSFDREMRPILDSSYNHYHDSDNNTLHRYTTSGSFWFGNQKYGLSFRHTDADDPTRSNWGNDVLFRISSRLTDGVSTAANLGFTQLNDHGVSSFPVGLLRLDAKLFSGTVGTLVGREVLTDTAELIQNRIRMTNAGVYLSQPITERFSFNAAYNYKSFSDDNHANDLQLSPQYALSLSPRIVVGDRLRFLDYLKQSHSGYFDPNNYIANRAFSSIYYEHRFFYTYLEGYLGYQSFTRYGAATKEFIHGGSGSLGFTPVPRLAVELNVEGGNFAAGTASGFSYFTIGPRVLLRF